MTFNAVDLYPYHAADGPMYAETVVKCSPFYIMTIRASIHGQSSNIEVRKMSNPLKTIVMRECGSLRSLLFHLKPIGRRSAKTTETRTMIFSYLKL